MADLKTDLSEDSKIMLGYGKSSIHVNNKMVAVWHLYHRHKILDKICYVKLYNTFGYQVSNANLSARKLWNNSMKTRKSVTINDVIEEGFVFKNCVLYRILYDNIELLVEKKLN